MTTEALPELRDSTPEERPTLAPIILTPPAVVPSPIVPPAATAPTIAAIDPKVDKTDIAKKAADTRWANKFDWETCTIPDGLNKLAEIKAEAEKAALTMQRRLSDIRVESATCYSCNKPIDVASGRFAGMRTRHNNDTGLVESAYACSAACFLKLTKDFVHKVEQRS